MELKYCSFPMRKVYRVPFNAHPDMKREKCERYVLEHRCWVEHFYSSSSSWPWWTWKGHRRRSYNRKAGICHGWHCLIIIIYENVKCCCTHSAKRRLWCKEFHWKLNGGNLLKLRNYRKGFDVDFRSFNFMNSVNISSSGCWRMSFIIRIVFLGFRQSAGLSHATVCCCRD